MGVKENRGKGYRGSETGLRVLSARRAIYGKVVSFEVSMCCIKF